MFMSSKLGRLAQAITILLIFLNFMIAAEQATAADLVGPSSARSRSASHGQDKFKFSLEHIHLGVDNAFREFGSARGDHAAIALNIGQCYYAKISDPIHWSPSVKAILLFELDNDLMHSLDVPTNLRDAKPPTDELLVLNPFHAAAISFSDRISRDRLEVRGELEDRRSRSSHYQVAILISGAVATILVSVKSIMRNSARLSNAFGICAVIASAAVTALSSMNAFDGSQSIALRDQRTLSQLQQLHWRIASDVLTRPELCKDHDATSAGAMEMVASWRNRLEAIRDDAVETIARPGDLSTGKAPNAGAAETGGRTPGAVATR